MKISVMLCINNPDNGIFCGRCAAVNIQDFLDLDSLIEPSPRCTMKHDRFWMHRQPFHFSSHQTWVGNWCWDAITISVAQAAEMVAMCLQQKIGESDHPIWGIDTATGQEAIEIADKHRRGEAITTSKIDRALRIAFPPTKPVSHEAVEARRDMFGHQPADVDGGRDE